MKETGTAVNTFSANEDSTEELLKTVDREFEDKILRATISEIVLKPRLKQRFVEALVTEKGLFLVVK